MYYGGGSFDGQVHSRPRPDQWVPWHDDVGGRSDGKGSLRLRLRQ